MKTQGARSLPPDALFDPRTRVAATARGGVGRAEAARVVAAHRSAVSRRSRAARPGDLRPRRRGRPPARGSAPRGRPPVVRVSGEPHRVNAIGTPTDAGVPRSSVFAGRFTAPVPIASPGRLLRSATGVVSPVLDGRPAHRGRKVARWVAGRADRLRLFFLPPYRPELNPTGHLNHAVKGTVPRVKRARTRGGPAGQVRT